MNLNIQAPINALSFGIWSQNIVAELGKAGHNIYLYPISGRVLGEEIQNKDNISHIGRAIENSHNSKRFDNDAPSIRIFHPFSLAEKIGNKLKVGITIFELNSFTEDELINLNSCELIIVPSKWAKEIVAEHVPAVKCEVAPLGIDPSLFNLSYSKTPTPNTIFYFCGKWELRKGCMELCDTFNAAFEVDDKVELWLSPHNYFLTPEQTAEWVNYFKNSKLGDKIKIIPRLTNQADLAKIVQQVDCCISLSRAEGWNLPLLEAMACGKHIITTNYSAHTEFCNSRNSLLIEIDELEDAYDGIWFHGQGQWAALGEKQLEQAINYMREIHTRKQDGESMLNEGGLVTAEEFTWENSAKKLIDILEEATVGCGQRNYVAQY